MENALLNQKPHIGANFLPQPKSARQRAVDRWFLKKKPPLRSTTVSDKTVPGQYFDSETNLHYNRYRYYDPQLGRYITSDPIGLNGGSNTYLYALANPIIYYDPDGESIKSKIAEAILFIAATIGSGGGDISKTKPPRIRPPIEEQQRREQGASEKGEKKGEGGGKGGKGGKGAQGLVPWEISLLMLCISGSMDCNLCESYFDDDFCPEGVICDIPGV